MNYLLANKSDKAIQLFVDLIKVDKETMETHLALGNLFRSKGEVDRAIKIHQNLIARPDLDQGQRGMALSELAEDYFKAGLLDRAENLYRELVQINPQNRFAQRKLFEIFCVEKSWTDALAAAQVLYDLAEPDGRLILTHCLCEIAGQYLDKGNLREAHEFLKKATQIDDKCIRALLSLIDVHLKNNEAGKATSLLKKLIKSNPQFIELFIRPAREIYLKRGSAQQYQSFLINQYASTPHNTVAIELLDSYKSCDQQEALVKFLHQAIQNSATFELFDFAFKYYQSRPEIFNRDWPVLLSQFPSIKPRCIAFICNSCGYESQTMQWNCPSCNTWSSLKPV
ncbi:MAG: tetratricopeptide repeat protein [Gammaproteobacteria bacterium]|nr:tetratricopeptide repeat protein [Gammaproteobacteria bacterium]